MKAVILTLATAFLIAAGQASAEQEPSPERALLKRMYQIRMAVENDRLRAENEARANVRLVTQGDPRQSRADSPTVTAMRQQTSTQLARFEQRLRCLDVDVNPTGGNTVVICGDNNGNINGSNTTAGGDIVTDIITVDGGAP